MAYKITRRDFIKSLGLLIGSAAIPKPVLELLPPSDNDIVTQRQIDDVLEYLAVGIGRSSQLIIDNLGIE